MPDQFDFSSLWEDDAVSPPDGSRRDVRLRTVFDIETAPLEGQTDDRAALHPLTGQVIAIGYRFDTPMISSGPEDVVLRTFWARFVSLRDNGGNLIGFNIAQFDVPFLVRRSWLVGVDVPDGVFADANNDQLSGVFVDLYRRWKCGAKWSEESCGHVSQGLDSICRAMGIGGKHDGLKGNSFASLWFGSEADREQAILYLQRELEMTAALSRKMGVK